MRDGERFLWMLFGEPTEVRKGVVRYKYAHLLSFYDTHYSSQNYYVYVDGNKELVSHSFIQLCREVVDNNLLKFREELI